MRLMLRGWPGAREYRKRIGYARDGRSLLLTKAIEVPKQGEIPAHEKFYYLELFDGLAGSIRSPDENFIQLKVSEENRQQRC